MGAGSDDGARSLGLAAAAGDRAALERLLDEHADLVHAVCRRIVRDPQDALDAAQEAMIAVVRGIASYDGRARFTTWLYRVATNAALMELRRRARRPTPQELTVDPAADRSGPDREVAARLDVEAALAALPVEQRVVVVLREFEDLEYEQIAVVLGVPIGTVRSRLNRARRALLRSLGNPTPPPTHQSGQEVG